MKNAAQIEYWNTRAGQKWAELRQDLDAMLAPATSLLMSHAAPLRGVRVLDVGCGTGETCAIAADAGAAVTGVDISAPMLAEAYKRVGESARLLEADASVYRDSEPFDLVLSRFGVMFFEDPVAAFSNIAANLKPGGRVLFSCWQAPSENEWATVPMAAIRDLVPAAPPPDPTAPGPFAFASDDRVRSILTSAGFDAPTIAGHRIKVSFAETGGAARAAVFGGQIGPAAAAMAEMDAETRATARARLVDAFKPFETGGAVRLGGAIWIVEARTPG